MRKEAHTYKIICKKFDHLTVATLGTKAEADKEVEQWIAKEPNLKGATYKEIKGVSNEQKSL